MTWPKSRRHLGRVRTGNTMCVFFHIFRRLKTKKTMVFIYILFQLLPVLSFLPHYLLTQISHILKVRTHIFNANNAFLEEVVNTHNIFMFCDLIVVQSLSCVQLFVTPQAAACQASLSFTISQGLLKLMSIKLVMPSKHLFLCRPLLLLPSIFPSIRIFSNESALHIKWPKY